METTLVLFGTPHDGKKFQALRNSYRTDCIFSFSIKTDVITDYLLQQSNTSILYDCYPTGKFYKSYNVPNKPASLL